ncbi:hypothetical protein CYMTET_37217 [Cymbomonas tetramitiformis]|uniref:NADP-dependent oxidoreductase domain-containing protein n=1 Tax=Cymbomonas tetramitiformis TaxID=36881 RepID=A0AAE0CEB5_9CHLO|nr:hypothetical protein CYMTET_37217 [Cymbomonas tetramitiformis]
MTSTLVKLRNGVDMPRLGLGTHKAQGTDVINAVRWALESGYKHIDTATIYKNEGDIAAALGDEVARDQIFITTKISPYEQGYDKAMAAAAESLDRLQVDHVDCMLVHWPGVARTKLDAAKNKEGRKGTWHALEDLHAAGKCRAIGVSNYTAAHLEDMKEYCNILPMVNQVEMHPFLPQTTLRRTCAEMGVQVVAYSPLGTGELLSNPVVQQIAKDTGRESSQVLLRWALQHDVSVIPKSVNRDRIHSNAALHDFCLSAEHMGMLDALECDHHFCWDSQSIA